MPNHPNRDWPRRWRDDPAARAVLLREWRKRMGYTQAALAGVLGCSKRAVEEWEGGRNAAPAYLGLALRSLGD